jgi:hypothetical protein
LRDKNRELVYKGPLKCRGGPNAENADLLVFLFDHALLMVKPKWVNKHEQYKVYRKVGCNGYRYTTTCSDLLRIIANPIGAFGRYVAGRREY